MILHRINNTKAPFQALTKLLDSELNARYGNLQNTYDKHNVIAPIETVLVGFDGDEPIACGCFKNIDDTTVEIKRMFIVPKHRRKGFSSQILRELEQWAYALGYRKARLETGKSQPEAIGLYQKHGYEIIDNFEPYIGMSNSVCMQKTLKQMMAQCSIQTPVGKVIATADEVGVCTLDFDASMPEKEESNAHLEQLKCELAEYFAGKRSTFDVALHPIGTAFQLSVWQCLCAIPYGHTVSYSEEAKMLNHPTATRAVANANGKNPLPIIIPCHRVIAKDKSLGGYSGGLWRKEILLELERNR